MSEQTTDQQAPLEPGQGETNDPTDASETATYVAPEDDSDDPDAA